MELKNQTTTAVSQELVSGRAGLGNCRRAKRLNDLGATRPNANTLFGAPCEWMRHSHSVHDISIARGDLKSQV